MSTRGQQTTYAKPVEFDKCLSSANNADVRGRPRLKNLRSSRACETCHVRKVRCDVSSRGGGPCTNCVAFTIDCKLPRPKSKMAKYTEKMPSALYSSGPESATAQLTQTGSPEDYTRNTLLHSLPSEGHTSLLYESTSHSSRNPTKLNSMEISILRQRGAFAIPPKLLCDELVEAYFQWVAPILPVVSRTRFMRQYRDAANPPPLLLLHAIFLAGSKVCASLHREDTTSLAMSFYRRAKALYDADYEDDRVTIVQALVIMSWYWDGTEDVTENVFYWSRVAIITAQELGMHRSVKRSKLSTPDKRLWRRIWWTLFTRDRSVAVALGRPLHIDTGESDIEMICEDDFEEGDNEFTPNTAQVRFFLEYVRLCEIMGLVLSYQYAVAAKVRRKNAMDLAYSDMALAYWLQNCPEEIHWEASNHNFWSALLYSNYYSTLCLLHRSHMPEAISHGTECSWADSGHSSRNIAFKAATAITSIVECLGTHGELQYSPVFMVHVLSSAISMQILEMRSPIICVKQGARRRVRASMDGLKEISRIWMVAKMTLRLFESLLQSESYEYQGISNSRTSQLMEVEAQKQREDNSLSTNCNISGRSLSELHLSTCHRLPSNLSIQSDMQDIMGKGYSQVQQAQVDQDARTLAKAGLRWPGEFQDHVNIYQDGLNGSSDGNTGDLHRYKSIQGLTDPELRDWFQYFGLNEDLSGMNEQLALG